MRLIRFRRAKKVNEVLSHNTTHFAENLSAAVYMGMFCGGILCGMLSDRVGRKPCLEYALTLNSVAALASAFSPNITALIIFRVMAGIGIGATMPSVFGMAAEIFPWTVRGKMISIVVRCQKFLMCRQFLSPV